MKNNNSKSTKIRKMKKEIWTSWNFLLLESDFIVEPCSLNLRDWRVWEGGEEEERKRESQKLILNCEFALL